MIQIRCYFITVLMFFSIIAQQSFAQFSVDSTALIVKTNGTPNSDIGYAVACDVNGNTFTSGQFTGTINFGGISVMSSTPTASLVKYSTNGTVLWAKNLQSNIASVINDIEIASDGTIWCVGTFKTNVVFGANIELNSGSLNSQGFIAQYNTNGTCIQAKKLESNLSLGTVLVTSLSLLQNGSIIVGGSFNDSIYFGNSIGISGVLTHEYAFVAKFTSSLNCLWGKRIKSNYDSKINDVAFDTEGNVVCVGTFADSAYIADNIFVGQANSLGLNLSSFIAKYSSDGTPIWIRSFIEGGDENISSVAVDNSNNYYVCGTTDGISVGIEPILATSSHQGSEELFIASISSNGDGIWVKSFGSSNDDKATKILLTKDSILYFSGKIEGTALFGPTKTLISNGSSDGFIAKLKTKDGSLEWARNFGGSGSDFITTISANPTLGISAVGYTSSSFIIQGVSYPNIGGNDLLFMVVGELTTPTISRPIGTISFINDTLNWVSAIGADSSFIQIRENDSTNGQIVLSQTFVKTDTSFVLPSLHYGRTYFYRTQSKLISGVPSAFSSWSSFSVVSLPIVAQIFPRSESNNIPLQTELRWNKPNNLVDSVILEVKRDSLATAVWLGFSKTNADTVQVLPLLQPNRVYYWRGKTKAPNGDTSSWSDWASFTTENVLRPVVKSPLNGAVNVLLSAELLWNSPSLYVDTVYLQVRENNETGALLAEQTYLNRDSVFLTSSIPTQINSQYVWRLRFGSKELGAGQWTNWNSFKTVLPGGSYNELCAKITGNITDDGGAPILSGVVTAWRTDVSQGDSTIFLFTDSIVNGSYSIDVPEGSYMIFTNGNDFFRKWYLNSSSRANAEIQTIQCSDSLVRNITVTKNPLATQTFTVRGTIRSKATNLPLIASVQLLPVNNEFQNVGAAITTTSDASGRYELVVPSLQGYLGVAIAPNHSLRVYDTATAYIEGRLIRSGMSDPLNVNFFLDEIPTELQNNGIQGVWKDSSNNPVQGKVIAYRYATLEGDTTVQARFFYSTSTDSTGAFLIKGLEKGKYKIMNAPEDENLVARFYTFPSPYCIPNWNNSTTITVDTGIVTLMNNVVSRKKLGDQGAASWTISVVQKTSPLMHSGKKIYEPSSTITEPGVIITLFDKNGGVSDYGFTDVNGNASSASLTAGTFEYEASKVGFLPKKGTIVVTATGIEGGIPVIELEKATEDVISSVSLEEVDGVLLYPNPVQKQLTIENVPNLAMLESLTIQDIRGIEYKLPFDIFYSEGRIVLSVSSLPKGWYTLLLSMQSNSYSYQFIKQ
jgi:hypothetical protein